MFIRFFRHLAFPLGPRLSPFGVQNPPKSFHRGLCLGRVRDDVMSHGCAHVRMAHDHPHRPRIPPQVKQSRPKAASKAVPTSPLLSQNRRNDSPRYVVEVERKSRLATTKNKIRFFRRKTLAVIVDIFRSAGITGTASSLASVFGCPMCLRHTFWRTVRRLPS